MPPIFTSVIRSMFVPLIARVAPALVSPVTGVTVGGVVSPALTIVRPFHVVAVPKPSAAIPMFATGSLPTGLKASGPTVVGAFPSNVTDVSKVASLKAQVPMKATLFGMVIEVSDEAARNEPTPIEVSALPASKVTVSRAIAW